MPRAAWCPGGRHRPYASRSPATTRAAALSATSTAARAAAAVPATIGVAVSKQKAPSRWCAGRRQLRERHRTGIGGQLEGVGHQRARAVDVAGGQRIGPGRIDQLDQLDVMDRDDRIRPEFVRLHHGETAIGRKGALDLDRPLRCFEAGHFATGHELDQAGVAQVGVAANDSRGRWARVHGPRVYRAAAGQIARASYTRCNDLSR